MNTNEVVDAWFEASDHPQKELMFAFRELILSDRRMAETIKWKTPTFMYKGNLASINPQAKKFLSVLFHTGASIPGNHPLLMGGGDTARYMQLHSMDDLEAARPAVVAIIEAWCSMKDS